MSRQVLTYSPALKTWGFWIQTAFFKHSLSDIAEYPRLMSQPISDFLDYRVETGFLHLANQQYMIQSSKLSGSDVALDPIFR
jgi:hypothetical protein